MALTDILKQIDDLQEKINSFGKFDKDILNRINYKFRLDWNYHSNAMEGNSLTREETRSVMINNVTIDGKPLEDAIEMEGHNTVITEIMKIGKGELKISEKRIKDIHKAIIKEKDPAQQEKIGKWKTTVNTLRNYKGEDIEFTAPNDVPAEMHKLLNWLNANYDAIATKKKGAMHPVLMAFHFHVVYVSIHPFYDGNGRTARILMNLILIAFGYPPVIVKLNDKQSYGNYLADIQAYGGSPDLFLEYMCGLLVRSQNIVLTAIEGGDIEEEDDIDKQFALLNKRIASINPEKGIKELFSGDVLLGMYDTWISKLFEKSILEIQRFNEYFKITHHKVEFGNIFVVTFGNNSAENIVQVVRKECEHKKLKVNPNNLDIVFSAQYSNFSRAGADTFDCYSMYRISFNNSSYGISASKFLPDHNGMTEEPFMKDRKLFHQVMSEKEINELVKSLKKNIIAYIEFNMEKRGL